MKNWAPSTTSARPKLRGATIALISLALALVIASCGPNPKPETDAISRVGVVLLSQVGDSAIPTGHGSFAQLTQERAKELMEQPLGAEVGTCTVMQLGSGVAGPIVNAPNVGRLSVPDLNLAANGVAYAQLQQAESGSFTLVGATAPLPSSGLTVSLPASSTFPAFNNMAVATGEAPILEAGFDPDAIDTTTEFRWVAGESGAAMLLIGSGNNVTFSCLADDAPGAFSFPEETRDALTSAGFVTGNLETLGRLSMSSATDGGSAQLLVGTLRLASLGATE